MTAEVPAGWYPDPANPMHERWWDATGWTGATREPAQRHGMASVAAGVPSPGTAIAAAPPDGGRFVDGPGPQPQRTRRSLGVGLVVVLAAIVGVFGTIAFLELREPAVDAGVETDTSATGSDPGGAPTDEPTDEPTDGPTDGPTDDDGATTPPDEGSSDEQAAADAEQRPEEVDEPDAPRLITVTLDDQCTLTLDASAIARSDDIRPWNHPECTWAPVALPRGGERWIVVLASLNGDDFGSQETQARAAALGVPGSVLWSTHYPSLNPSLWVVFDGPFPSESAAASAARGWGSAAYPRVLSDDLGDRYCLSPDGCVGEQAN